MEMLAGQSTTALAAVMPKNSASGDTESPVEIVSPNTISMSTFQTTSTPYQTEATVHSTANSATQVRNDVVREEERPQRLERHHAQYSSSNSDASELTCASGHPWTPGTYVLLNARGGTALDLSGADQRTLIGFPAHMGQNQQWEFLPSGRGYTIRSACHSLCGLYLSVEQVCDDAQVIASPFPASWNVQLDEKDGSMRISWPNTDFVIDLADGGSATPGTKVQLTRAKSGELCQSWKFTRCEPARDQDEKLTRNTSQPIIAETVIVSEGSDYITTTRTTTTTVITTVTTVTKTAKASAVKGA
ncbi:carbohydrate-binding module family 13 protein [Wolfiporia cocos MD-104 SS10]|uniref:Carbohydrate-binding module family 13 protein n=1 Tax=Wolfiporia cocos (strain MD-104) TaxID=742152 RepID=A0A2H3J4X5_WOLCO|nr:carbohydrate-binding module family 13 protein [Wolfiporia cocos MD-104 SS10]